MQFGFFTAALIASLGIFGQTNAVLLTQAPADLSQAAAEASTVTGLNELVKQFAEIEANIKAHSDVKADPMPSTPAGLLNGDYKFVMGEVQVDGLGQWGQMAGGKDIVVEKAPAAAPAL